MVMVFGVVYSISTFEDLTTTNILSTLPNTTPIFVMFYNKHCDHCSNYVTMFNKIIEALKDKWPLTKFYAINGPGSPDLIMKFKEIEYYPTFVYIEPLSSNITKIFTAALHLGTVKGWAENILTELDKNEGYTRFNNEIILRSYKEFTDGLILVNNGIKDIESQLLNIKIEELSIDSIDKNFISLNLLFYICLFLVIGGLLVMIYINFISKRKYAKITNTI